MRIGIGTLPIFMLTNPPARETHKDYIGGGNYYPPAVRKIVKPNDFAVFAQPKHADALSAERSPSPSEGSWLSFAGMDDRSKPVTYCLKMVIW
ncbi:hypothetical protein [Agrobacterium larrymoorei]|uniref:Uncharacterized protein n=1 Tax=Agrobacterium larrymoorei TaxID=160699 RepID=A0A4D7E5L7_9HYPH|nr:hypothetical protein [Agrobacterium larrymoorei]QCJ00531.1 hypothetical protein CFBP5473_21210 [Agrobacterium larrymoorei]QYA10527.1 hypothetical protein J5285_25350 [Agrobacterium larrymoorei]